MTHANRLTQCEVIKLLLWHLFQWTHFTWWLGWRHRGVDGSANSWVSGRYSSCWSWPP